jgi:hypothetical protein
MDVDLTRETHQRRIQGFSSFGDNRKSQKGSKTHPLDDFKRTYKPVTVYHRGATEYTDMKHSFDFAGAVRLGLGIGIGLIVSIPIGIFIALISMLLFGSAFVGMLQAL